MTTNTTITNTTIIRCSICGGVINGALHHTGDFFCICPTKRNAMEGWICPRCGQSNSPFKMKCDCTGFTVTFKSNFNEK